MNTLATELSDLHLLKHPFYQDWMEGRLTVETLRDYAGQYFTHVKAFPRYIAAMLAQCENPEERRILLENLADEEGFPSGTPHPELWKQFALGLGVEASALNTTSARAAIQNVVQTFFRLAGKSRHEGLAALYAYEQQVPEIAESKIAGLKANYGVKEAETLAFFEAHRTADVYHREALEKIMASFSATERTEALAAAREAAQSLWNFLTEVHVHNGQAVAC